MKKIKTIFVIAKCSDLCSITYYDKKVRLIGERERDYVPKFFPDNGGDYIELNIDIETGKILNWKKPTQKELMNSMNK